MTNDPRRKLLQAATRLIPVAVLWGHAALHWGYTSTETAVTCSYVRTLVEGGGIALQAGAVESHGFASPLWLLLLAGISALGAPLLLGAKLLGALLAGLTLWLLPAITARLLGRPASRPLSLDLLPPLLLALHPALGLHAAGGTETALGLLLLTLALLLFVGEEARFARGEDRGLWASAIPLALLLLAQPEAPLLVGAFLIGRVLARASAARLPRGFWAWLALPLLVYVAYLLGAYLLFADPWPGALTAGMALEETRLGGPVATSLGWRSVAELYRAWGLTVPLCGVALVGALRPRVYWARIALLALALGGLAGVVLVGGDPSGRRALPLALALALLLEQGLGALLPPLRGLLHSRGLWFVGAATLALGLCAGPAAAFLHAVRLPPPSPYAEEAAVTARLRAIVEDLGFRPEQVTVLAASPGVLAWEGFKVLDISGVTDPVVRRCNGKHRPLELRDLVFHRRQPDLLMEGPPWRHVHRLADYPEAGRTYVRRAVEGHPELSLGIARRLLLETPPRPSRLLQLDLGAGLELLGARVEPGQFVLLWTARRNGPPQRWLRLGIGQRWTVRLPVGPKVYPMPGWRAGEVVRQVVRLPRNFVDDVPWLEIEGGGTRHYLEGLDLGLARLAPAAWTWRQLEPAIGEKDWTRVEALLWLWRKNVEAPVVHERIVQRIGLLTARGLLVDAGRQLAAARISQPFTAQLKRVARTLADKAYRRGLEHIRTSRWPLAHDSLAVAAVADPRSAWIARRLEDARSRLPAEGRLVNRVELELARRALVLAPSARGLGRLMRAHLALGQAAAAVAAHQLWSSRLGSPDRRCQFLLAKALSANGQKEAALAHVERLLAGAESGPQPRRCPPWFPLQALALSARLGQLHIPPRAPPAEPAFDGPAIPLARGSDLVAHCARWSPGEPVTVALYLRQRGWHDLPLELGFGPRRNRFVVQGSGVPLRRVQVTLRLPPATYPVTLRGPDGRIVPLGQVAVGPEANFGFELPTYPPWHRQGEAFGAAPAVGRASRWRFLAGYEGERYADSYVGDDRREGSLTSPPFRLRRGYLMLLLAGGDVPGLGVDLLVEGQRIFTARPNLSEVMRLVLLPVGRHRGRWAQVVIRDDSDRPWGHLAVDEIRQLDGPAPGIAP